MYCKIVAAVYIFVISLFFILLSVNKYDKVINAYDFISCSIPSYPYLKYSKFKLLTYLEDILANIRMGDNYFDSQVKGVWDHIGQSIGGLESSKG